MPAFLHDSTGGSDDTRWRLYGQLKRFLDWGEPVHDDRGRNRVLYRWSEAGLRQPAFTRWALLRSVVQCADMERVASCLQWLVAADSQKADSKAGWPHRWFDYMVAPDGEIFVRPRPGMAYKAVPKYARASPR